MGDNAKSQRKLGSAMILEWVSCCCNQASLSGCDNISGRLKLILYSLHDMGPPGEVVGGGRSEGILKGGGA